MDSWDLTTLDVEVHKPSVLRSDRGAARAIAINLPAGDMLQEHEVHEHAYLVVVDGELEIAHDGGTEAAGVGYVAHWEPHERHEVRAKRDSRFLLFLAPWPSPEDRTTAE
ncbi:MAG TPA: cupin domain-containing protein [Solirubrobacteraceae bacterium]|nr:cupin domain-containing protein [Solirubrobacteraceae bacterium]